MKLQGIALGLFSLAIAGVLTIVQAQQDNNGPGQNQGQGGMQGGGERGMHHWGHGGMQQKLDRLSEQLNLTPNQKLQVQTIFEQMRTNIMTAVEQARTNASTQLQQVLTPQQYQQWQQIWQQHEQRWHEHMTNEWGHGSSTNETENSTGGTQ